MSACKCAELILSGSIFFINAISHRTKCFLWPYHKLGKAVLAVKMQSLGEERGSKSKVLLYIPSYLHLQFPKINGV